MSFSWCSVDDKAMEMMMPNKKQAMTFQEGKVFSTVEKGSAQLVSPRPVTSWVSFDQWKFSLSFFFVHKKKSCTGCLLIQHVVSSTAFQVEYFMYFLSLV